VEVSESIQQKCIKPTKETLAFREFRAQLEKEGLFQRNWFWDFFYISIIVILAIIGTYISSTHPIIASILIGFAMQQAGWIGHDYVHGRGKMSYILGRMIGSLFNAFSSEWWSAKHNKHHVHTNQLGIDDDIQNDPILHLWIPSPDKEFTFRPYQHLYYHFVYAFLYVSWRLQSLGSIYERKDKLEGFLAMVNYIWLASLPLEVSLLSVLIGGWLVAEVVTATHQSEDILEGQSYNYCLDQFNTTRDVDISNPFFNWLWGGMQYQLEHHLFPTMPKYYYRTVRERVKQFAKANGIEYRMSSSWDILIMNYQTMRKYSAVKN